MDDYNDTNFEEMDFDNFSEFAENPEPRCPVVLLLDRSGSMMHDGRIDKMNAGVEQLKQELLADPLATARVEIAIISFGPVKVMDVRNGSDQDMRYNLDQAFVTMNNLNYEPLTSGGETPMGEAVELALQMLRDRKATYKTNGIDYFRPWIFLITDGHPTDHGNFPKAFELVKEEERRKGVVFFAVGVDISEREQDTLRNFTDRGLVYRMESTRFAELFQWVSKSLSAISQSRPGEQVALDKPMFMLDTSV